MEVGLTLHTSRFQDDLLDSIIPIYTRNVVDISKLGDGPCNSED